MSEGVVAAASSLITDLSEGEEVIISNLTSESTPGHILYACGACLHKTQTELTNFHKYITWLRARGIRLTDQEMEAVKGILRKSKEHGEAEEKSISRYARTLRSMLSCKEEDVPKKVFNYQRSRCPVLPRQ